VRLEARELAFGYPGRPVGRDASFALEAGEVICLLGPNGSGKTTLFKTLLGLLPAQGGRVLLDNVELTRWPRAKLARAVAYVPQAQMGVFPYSVLDVVLMGRTAHLGPFGTPGAADREAAWAALQALRIDHLAQADYTRISGGQRQLALIARALAQAARILVMDEPTASLDFGNQVLVLGHIRALAGRGIGVVLSTHAPDHAFACADRVIVLSEGRILAQGPPDAIVTTERLKEVYGVDVRVVRAPGLPRPVCVPELPAPQIG
jgi:iron complex transport system ATP-binding protein